MGADLRQQLGSAAFRRFAEEHRGKAQARANGFLDDAHSFDRAKAFRGPFFTGESAAQFLDQADAGGCLMRRKRLRLEDNASIECIILAEWATKP